MIDSILQRHIDPVILHNITKPNEIITEPNEIKEEIRKHFKSWTKSNLLNYNYWPEWEKDYQPQNSINIS